MTTATPSTLEPTCIGPTWRRGEDGRLVLPALSLGWHWAAWAKRHLQHGDGRSWKYTGEQFRFLLWWGALDEHDRFVFRDGVLQRLKGWGKDPFGSTLCAIEFVGPSRPAGKRATAADHKRLGVPVGQPLGCSHPEAWVQTAAVSKDQTRNTMTLFPSLFKPETIGAYEIDLGKEIIYAHHGAQRLEAVTSSPRTLEGARSTFVLRNETHHWLSNNEGHEMDAVIDRNVTKSADGAARSLSITNAYDPSEDSVAQRAREAYEKAEAGESLTTGILYDSVEASAEASLTAEAAPAVIRGVRGDSVWLDVDRIVQSILDTRNPPSRSRRFFYNQITAAEDSWLTFQEWDAIAAPERGLEEGNLVVLFFDGSKSDDATGLVACRASDGHVVTLGCWQRPQHAKKGWTVPREEVDRAVELAFATYDVRGFFADPGAGEDESGERYWDGLIDQWARRYGRRLNVKATQTGVHEHAVMWDMSSPERQGLFTQACERVLSEIKTKAFTHDGDLRLRNHVRNARRRPNRYGVSIGKEHRESQRKIDLAVCMIGARMLLRVWDALPDRKKRGRPKGEPVFL